MIVALIIIFTLVFYVYYNRLHLPNNETCFQKVERENSFCSSINEEECEYYQNRSNSIPNGGNCFWIEQTSSCTSALGGCD